MKTKNWNKNKDFYELTPLLKRSLLRVWIKVWSERLDVKLTDEDVNTIYDNNIINIDKIFFPNTLFLIEKYLKENKNIKLEYDINSF